MKKELPKIYDPKKYEDKIYEKWEKSGYFNPDNLEGDPYSIMMPPPNVTGVLHLGHALENSLMDIMTRFQRMKGKKVLLLPGTDHAAVATQAKVEKILVEKGISNPRKELGREKLLEKIRDYSEKSKATILSQIRKMGTSCDWSRLAYTFDEERTDAVNEVFKKMYDDGLIYRGHRVVNWSVKGQSTCSDDELVHIERTAKLYTFKYASDFPISISTTRPETKLGDTAVAVNPKDKRYKKYIGQVFTADVGAQSPLEIKIIADENIDSKFGTGAVGVTPAHSQIDFEMYEKQKAAGDPINLIQVIDQQGNMTREAGKDYAGLKAEEARGKFVLQLKKKGLLEKEEEITQNVGTSDRFGDIVEAIPMTQWWINVNKEIPKKGKSLKDLMREAVTIGHNNNPDQKINITPKRFEKAYFGWIENLRDWCISRQVWWGHRIPVWYKGEEIYVGTEKPKEAGWRQDEDTLDTWFSSGLWTFSTLGWPDNTEDLKTFHPASWMQMGYEILFFWMARMILMSTYALDEIPFKDVYIHGILRNEKGKKFSKSEGNSLDPLEIIEKYGTDSLRLSLIGGITPGNDSSFYEEKVESCRNFTNKIWNISRFVMQKNGTRNNGDIGELKNLSLSDFWILGKMEKLIGEIEKDLDEYNFSQAEEKLKDFTWNDFADWYLEVSKFENNDSKNQILSLVLKDILKLWHPFVPFVTEVIWSELGEEDMLMIQKWPERRLYEKIISQGKDDLKSFGMIIDLIKSIRNARIENKIDPRKKIKVILDIKNIKKEQAKIIESQKDIIMKLRTGIDSIEISQKGEKVKNAIHRSISGINVYLPTEGLIDLDKIRKESEKELEKAKKYVSALESKIKNTDFIKKAPKEIVDQQKLNLEKAKKKMEEIKNHLLNL